MVMKRKNKYKVFTPNPLDHLFIKPTKCDPIHIKFSQQ